MSSTRRANGEINILAMLDGRSGRPLSKRVPVLPAALWYAGAAILACALVGALAWLAHGSGDPGGRQAEDAMLADTRPEPDAPAADAPPDTPPPLAPAAMQATAQSAAHSAAQAAAQTARNEQAAAEDIAAALATGTPQPGHVAGTGPVPAAAGGAAIVDLPAMPDAPAVALAGPTRARPASSSSANANVSANANASAAAAATTPATPPKLPAARALASHRPAVPPPHGAAPPRPSRRQAPAAGKVAPVVDTDVALISAIIQHTGRAGEDAGDSARTAPGASCAGKSCGPRMPDQP